MGGGAGFDPHHAGRKIGEEAGDLRPLKPSADPNAPRGFDAVDLKHALGKIKTESGNLHGGRLLFCGVFQ
jgi:hypothetical protein